MNLLPKYIETINDRRLLSLSLLLFLPVLLDFLTVKRGAVSSATTIALYGFFGIFMVCYSVRQIKISNVFVILVFWMFCWMNLIAFPNLNEYFSETSFLLSTFYFLPISALIIFRIDNWDNFFKIYTPFALLASLMGAFIVFFSNTIESGKGEFFSYMEFSYNMLPSCMGLYCVWRRTKNIKLLAGFTINFVSIVCFGSRAAVLYGLVFIVTFEIINSKVTFYKMLLITVIFIIIAIFLDQIVTILLQLGVFSNSRLLNHIVEANLFESRGRDLISQLCLKRINSVGFEFSGMFGDRPYLNGAIYPHNIIYEIIMQYGWLLGTLILGWLLYLISYDFFVKKYKTLVLFAILSLMGRYFISGSYLIEGKFWIFIFIILSINHFCHSKKSIIKHDKVLHYNPGI